MPKPAKTKAAKFQRWVDLMAALLCQVPLVFEEIARQVPAYRIGTTASAKRTFERDKAELRSLGVPIETVGQEGAEESAYRILPRDFYLPYLSVLSERGTTKPSRIDKFGYKAISHLTFESDELSAVAEAALRVRGLGDPALVADVDSAMRKLAFDLPVDAIRTEQGAIFSQSRTPAASEVLRTLASTVISRKRVTLDYFSMTDGQSAMREVEPFGLFFLNAHWYLVARDAESGETKNFRVNRVKSCVVNTQKPDSPEYAIPLGFRLRDHASSRQAWELGSEPVAEAIVEVRGHSGATVAATNLGLAISGAANLRIYSVRRQDAFARWLLSFAGELVPVEPPSLCEEYRRLVTATIAVYDPSTVAQ